MKEFKDHDAMLERLLHCVKTMNLFHSTKKYFLCLMKTIKLRQNILFDFPRKVFSCDLLRTLIRIYFILISG